jgi:hypothetical protein
MEKKDLNVKSYQNLKYKCTNLSELRDETIYRQIKMDTQREYLLVLFLYNIVRVYIDYYYMKNVCNSKFSEFYYNDTYLSGIGITKDKEKYFKEEMEGFKKFIESIPPKEILLEYPLEVICKRPLNISSIFYKIFNLYDDGFNGRIILQNLCGIELTQNEFYSVIIHFFNKLKYLQNMLEPYHNSRSIIIKNYYDSQEPTSVRGEKLQLKNSTGVEYLSDSNNGTFAYEFDEKFKIDVMNKNWNDGYDFYWKTPDENDEKKDISKCIKYLVEILTPNDEEIISMTITRVPAHPDKQIHFYIKKSLSTQIKYFIRKMPEYKNVSLLIHSFATWLFNANLVYSNLMPSMKMIFISNNIEVNDIDYYDTDEMLELSQFCIRRISNKINITEEFRKLWIGINKTKLLLDNHVKIYQLESSDKQDFKSKYLKYKMKYLQLKKIF